MVIKANLQYEVEGSNAMSWEILPEGGSVILEVGLPGLPPSFRIAVATAKNEDPRQAIDTCLGHFRTWLKRAEDLVCRSVEAAYPMSAQEREA